MANVYGVKYVAVSLVGEQRVSKASSINVLAESPKDAGDIARAHFTNPSIVELNIHLVHEIAKNVITVLDVQQPSAGTGDTGSGSQAAEAPVPNVDDVVKPLVESAEQKPGTDAA